MTPVQILLVRFLFTVGIAVGGTALLLNTFASNTLNELNASAVASVFLIIGVTGLAFAAVCGPIWAGWAVWQWAKRRTADPEAPATDLGDAVLR